MDDLQGKLSFRLASRSDVVLVRGWLVRPHIQPYFHGQGLQNTYDDLDKWVNGEPSVFKHWVALLDDEPFAYMMTSVMEKTDDPKDPYNEWIEEGKDVSSLDVLIGKEQLLGQGLGTRMIREFLITSLAHVDDVFIDPSAGNKRAIRVYEKVGFETLTTFIPPWDPGLHVLMRLSMETLTRSSDSL